MQFVLNLAIESLEKVWVSWQHNWPYLLASVVIASLLRLYVNAGQVSAFLKRYRKAGVVAATVAAVATPLCSCGTTAVILGMMASTMPWAPIVAFMVSSPLTSPEGLVYSAGLFGWPFASAFYLASILLGLGGGWLAMVFENRGWLANQARFAGVTGAAAAAAPCGCSGDASAPAQAAGARAQASAGCGESQVAEQPAGCGCGAARADDARKTASACCGESQAAEPPAGCGCGAAQTAGARGPAAHRVTLTAILRELGRSARYLTLMFTGFAFIGFFLNGLIPQSWVTAAFGGGNLYSVPLAATLGLPLYINSEASMPLLRALMDAGMSQGAGLAFMIAGSGTSIGAIGGALTIARWRVVGLVVGVLWAGAILCGYAYDLMLAMGLF